MAGSTVTLDDKYTLDDGRIYLTGTQALARLPLAQRRRDAAAGLSTGGFISGYRGSPLGGFDQALWKAKRHLADQDIHFQPGVNEDLGATAVWGSQQVGLWPDATVDGVFGLWYGKGPGVDRSGDVFKHANLAGTSAHGGVLAVAGDDHAAKSSTAPHQSEQALIAASIPVLHPASPQEVLDFGLYGWALSRYSGCWVALKALTEVVDTSASVAVDHDRPRILLPEDVGMDDEMPAGGLNIRWPDKPTLQEDRLLRFKLPAVGAFARANSLDREIWPGTPPRIGIIATGKGYLDTLEALHALGLDEDGARRLGIGLYKVGLVWPLEANGAEAFARRYHTLLVVEEKRDVIESQVKDRLYHLPTDSRPRIFGKKSPDGAPLLPSGGELAPAMIAIALGRILREAENAGGRGPEDLSARVHARLAAIEAHEDAKIQRHPAMDRLPYFCSGCPHNTSTKVPEGSVALGGIGCHYMATWMDRSTETFSQMGGEGVAWVGQSPFTERRHVFANIGDGTYFHSGSLAIRQAVAAKVNITYKLLYNDAVAMTGGQPVDGTLDVPTVIEQLRAEGVDTITVVSDEPEKYGPLGHGTQARHRDDLDEIQRDLRDRSGVSVLTYDQTCAAEKRRRRKRGTMADPKRRVVINDLVCEGCGDCSAQSNCLSVVPIETEYGRKRSIDQSSCNKDFSCLKGFCPSFVTLEGAEPRRSDGVARTTAEDHLPPIPDAPERPPVLDGPFNLLITGIGGTGVVTIGALIGMAAHIEGRGVSVLDQTGLAQKGGGVMSHVRIAASPEQIATSRIPAGTADGLIGGDVVVSSGTDVMARLSDGRTRAVINAHEIVTGAFTKNPDLKVPTGEMLADIADAVGGQSRITVIDATDMATRLFGDSIATNAFLLGMGWQKGLVPVGRDALMQAIALNGVAVDMNRAAFDWGRRAAHDPASVRALLDRQETARAPDHHRPSESLDEMIERRARFLTDYQDADYAGRYRRLVDRVRIAEETLRDAGADRPLTTAVARSAFKLMAYKDEYEVARLQTDPAFLNRLKQQFTSDSGGDFKMVFHLAPPIMADRDPSTGVPRKKAFGPWILPVFRVLARMRRLRGGPLDVFGYLPERRLERALIAEYFDTVDTICTHLTPETHRTAVALADLPQSIRGYGHIKEQAVAKARQRRDDLLVELLNPAPQAREAAE
ncbi:indolepyruvate ferredoxin oxidoreductase family protein [Fodinicurvata sp. EGI_FJ10296]|uniref:indolepyruvate ferredoxin oxidoreductase family protein n=1 Tax=Fodinicurvata sp. EGI_FJ10296 TaxID=3231908 RepID=UPI0034566539